MMNKAIVASLISASALAATDDCARGWYMTKDSMASDANGVTIFGSCTGYKTLNNVADETERGYQYMCDTGETYVMMHTFNNWKCDGGEIGDPVMVGMITSNASEVTSGMRYYDKDSISCGGETCQLEVVSYDPAYDDLYYSTCISEDYETMGNKMTYPVGICDEQGHMYECSTSSEYSVSYYSDSACMYHVATDDYSDGCNLFTWRDAQGNTNHVNDYYQRIKIKDCAGCTASSMLALVASAVALVLVR